MSSINLNMTSIEVKAQTRTLKASWTPELMDDLNSFHGLDPSLFEKYFLKEMRRDNRKKSIKNIFKD
jgi:hypothetical protein